MNCCDYQCNQGRDCPARKTDFLASEKARELDLATQWARFEVAGRLIVQATVAVVFFAAGFAFAPWLAKGYVL